MESKVQAYKKKAISTVKKGKETAIDTVKKGVDVVVKNPRKTVYVLGALVGVYLLYKVTRTTSNIIDDVLEADAIDTNVKGTGGKVDKNKLTITTHQASNFAQQLLDAMNVKEPFYGTDEKTIKAVFDKIKNQSDFLAVYNAFGQREYNGNNSPPKSAFWQWFDEYREQNLVYWLKSELDPKKDTIVYNKVKNIIELAGFAF